MPPHPMCSPCMLHLHCQTPVRCRLPVATPHAGAALPGCNRSLLAFPMKAEFFLIILVLKDFFFCPAPKGHFQPKPQKNESSLIQNNTPTPAAAPALAGRWHLTCFSENKKCNLGENKSTFFFIASYGGISNLNQEIIFI